MFYNLWWPRIMGNSHGSTWWVPTLFLVIIYCLIYYNLSILFGFIWLCTGWPKNMKWLRDQTVDIHKKFKTTSIHKEVQAYLSRAVGMKWCDRFLHYGQLKVMFQFHIQTLSDVLTINLSILGKYIACAHTYVRGIMYSRRNARVFT
jgi:hypothetical protein